MTIPTSECEALDALYTNTQGYARTHKEGWLEDVDVNSWRGVLVENGHVVEIQLPQNSLQGTLPAQIHDLPFLVSLNLEHNFIVDIDNAIGVGIDIFPDFTYLNLSYNLLQDLPESLGNMSALEDLYL